MFGTYRTLLALMVVAVHLGGAHIIGSYAVFGFYMISGYLMTLIMAENYGYTASGLYKYSVNRVLRIYPPYWVSILFSAGLVVWLGGEFTKHHHPAIYLPTDLSGTLRNLLLFFPFRSVPRLTPPAWALTVEIFYYIGIGLGLSRYKKGVLAWLAISVVYHAACVALQWGWYHTYLSIPAASLAFATGAAIYHYKAPIARRFPVLSGGGPDHVPGMIVMVMLANWGIGQALDMSKGLFFYTNYAICALMVLVLCERKTLGLISRRVDRFLGDLSYPIYLLHYQVGLVMLVALGGVGLEYDLSDTELMLFSLPVIFLISWLFNAAVDRPIEAIRTRVKRARPAAG